MTDSTASPTPCATRTRSSRVRLVPFPVSRTNVSLSLGCPTWSAGRRLTARPWCPTDRANRQYVLQGNTRDLAVRFSRGHARSHSPAPHRLGSLVLPGSCLLPGPRPPVALARASRPPARPPPALAGRPALAGGPHWPARPPE